MTKTVPILHGQSPQHTPECSLISLSKRVSVRCLLDVDNSAISFTGIQKHLARAWSQLHRSQKRTLAEHWSNRSPLFLLAPLMSLYPVAVHHDAYTLYCCSTWNGLSDERTFAPCLLWMLYSAAAHADGSFFPTEHSVMNNLYPFIQYVYDFDTDCELREQLTEAAAIRKRAFVDKRPLM